MNKIASLKQKLVNFAIKSGIAVAVCAGLAYFANNYFTQQSSELQQVESQINQKRNEISKKFQSLRPFFSRPSEIAPFKSVAAKSRLKRR